MMDGSDYPATKPYRPSNGTEGMMFMDRFCGRCKRDAKFRRTQDGADSCPIASASMAYDISDPKYPKEWVQPAHGTTPWIDGRCTAFRHEDDPGPSRPRKPRPAPLLELIGQ